MTTDKTVAPLLMLGFPTKYFYLIAILTVVCVGVFLTYKSYTINKQITANDLRKMVEEAEKSPLVLTDKVEKHVVSCVLDRIRGSDNSLMKVQQAMMMSFCNETLAKYSIQLLPRNN